MIASSGYQHAFFVFGIGQGVIVLVLAQFLRKPHLTYAPAKKVLKVIQSKIDFAPSQTLRQPVFWLLYVTFVMVAAGGLMATAQVGPIAQDYKIANVPVNIVGFELAALTFAISLDRIFDGFGRPLFGYISDNIGRENTMAIAFTIGAISLLTISAYGHNPIVFVLATALYFGVFGEIYSLFPATCGDTFGSKYAATNAGMLYTAKGTSALLVPLTSVLAAKFGWSAVFVVAVSLNVTAALLALFAIKPMRHAMMLSTGADSKPTADDQKLWSLVARTGQELSTAGGRAVSQAAEKLCHLFHNEPRR
jgi:MFS transporter, OFA family, oxalate/formate antiporter